MCLLTILYFRHLYQVTCSPKSLSIPIFLAVLLRLRFRTRQQDAIFPK